MVSISYRHVTKQILELGSCIKFKLDKNLDTRQITDLLFINGFLKRVNLSAREQAAREPTARD